MSFPEVNATLYDDSKSFPVVNAIDSKHDRNHNQGQGPRRDCGWGCGHENGYGWGYS